MAGAFRPPGRALALCGAWTCRSTGHRRARAGETRVAFPGPARRGGGTAPLPWQGPSPLPHRHTDPWPAACHSPRPAPDPPPAGASPPPGRALAFCCSRTCRSTGHRSARAGKRGSRFPARTDESAVTAPLAGAIAPATAPRGPLARGGPKPPAKRPPHPRPAPPAGAGLRCFRNGPDRTVAPDRAGKRAAFRRPPGMASPYLTDHDDGPARQAAGLL